jgi:hypothetical protein
MRAAWLALVAIGGCGGGGGAATGDGAMELGAQPMADLATALDGAAAIPDAARAAADLAVAPLPDLAIVCVGRNGACAAGACCAGLGCDQTTQTCQPPTGCGLTNAACRVDADCCGPLVCANGFCGPLGGGCGVQGDNCNNSAECCPGFFCSALQCSAMPVCAPPGGACGPMAKFCCDLLSGATQCDPAAARCCILSRQNPLFITCHADGDCCSGSCALATGVCN